VLLLVLLSGVGSTHQKYYCFLVTRATLKVIKFGSSSYVIMIKRWLKHYYFLVARDVLVIIMIPFLFGYLVARTVYILITPGMSRIKRHRTTRTYIHATSDTA